MCVDQCIVGQDLIVELHVVLIANPIYLNVHLLCISFVDSVCYNSQPNPLGEDSLVSVVVLGTVG